MRTGHLQRKNARPLHRGSLPRKSHLKALAECARVLRERYPVERVILFGSAARGTAKRDSDLDLLVVTTRRIAWQEKHELMDDLFRLQDRIGILVSPMVVSRKDWDEGLYTVLPIHGEVSRDGIHA
jgi:predicted nucleotidyltransferase